MRAPLHCWCRLQISSVGGCTRWRCLRPAVRPSAREVCQASGMRQAASTSTSNVTDASRLTLARSHHALADSRACRHPPPPRPSPPPATRSGAVANEERERRRGASAVASGFVGASAARARAAPLTRTSAWAVLLARAPARAAHRLASMVSPQRAHTRLCCFLKCLFCGRRAGRWDLGSGAGSATFPDEAAIPIEQWGVASATHKRHTYLCACGSGNGRCR